jgi:hypothetical protein
VRSLTILGAILVVACRAREGERPAAVPSGATTSPGAPAPHAGAIASVSLTACDTLRSQDAPVEGLPPPCRVRVIIGRDTILLDGVESTALPLTSGDSMLLGVAFDSSGAAPGIFAFSLATRVLRQVPLGDSTATALAISPDGRFLAYVRADRQGGLTGLIRRFVNGPIVLETPRIAVGGTDMEVGMAKWLAPDSVAFFFQPESLASTRWLRYRTGMREPAWVIDTITP